MTKQPAYRPLDCDDMERSTQLCNGIEYLIDEFVDAYRQIAEEAYTTPQVVKEAPHHAALGSRIQEDGLTEWKKFATTWRAYIKMKKDS